jgi:2-isopropylmalate synthase
VGAETSKIVLTARSGRSALAFRFKNLGYEFNRNDIDTLYEKFVQIADSLKEIHDENLRTLAKQFIEKVEI